MKMRNKTGPKTLPWDTPDLTGRGGDDLVKSCTLIMGVKEVGDP